MGEGGQSQSSLLPASANNKSSGSCLVDGPFEMKGEKGAINFLHMSLKLKKAHDQKKINATTVNLRFRLALWHKPSLKALPKLKELGVTHIVSLLKSYEMEERKAMEEPNGRRKGSENSESGSALKIGEGCECAGLHWLHIPFPGANSEHLADPDVVRLCRLGLDQISKIVRGEKWSQIVGEDCESDADTTSDSSSDHSEHHHQDAPLTCGNEGEDKTRIMDDSPEDVAVQQPFSCIEEEGSHDRDPVDCISTSTTVPRLASIPTILIHCSAGLHRTGYFSYGLQRILCGLSAAEARANLWRMRRETGEGVGDERISLSERCLVKQRRFEQISFSNPYGGEEDDELGREMFYYRHRHRPVWGGKASDAYSNAAHRALTTIVRKNQDKHDKSKCGKATGQEDYLAGLDLPPLSSDSETENP